MSARHEHRPGRPPSWRADMPAAASRAQQDALDVTVTAAHGSPEGRYFSGPGKPLVRQITELRDRAAGARARAEGLQAGVQRAERTDDEQKRHHRGGDRPWPFRLLILGGTPPHSPAAT